MYLRMMAKRARSMPKRKPHQICIFLIIKSNEVFISVELFIVLLLGDGSDSLSSRLGASSHRVPCIAARLLLVVLFKLVAQEASYA